MNPPSLITTVFRRRTRTERKFSQQEWDSMDHSSPPKPGVVVVETDGSPKKDNHKIIAGKAVVPPAKEQVLPVPVAPESPHSPDSRGQGRDRFELEKVQKEV